MTLNLSIVELIVLFFCAVVLGVVIHFFITSRKSLKGSSVETDKLKKHIDEWKLRYFNEVETKERELTELKSRSAETQDNSRIYQLEIDELRRQVKRMQGELENVAQHRPEVLHDQKPNYLDQLRMTQASLLEHNDKINQLLENIEVAKETEEQKKIMEEENEELINQVKELRYLLSDKDAEIQNIKKKENLTNEMTSMLDSAYNEFNTLQNKIQKLETQLSSSKMVSMEFEDMKEAFHKSSREHDEYKAKVQALTVENQQLTLQLNDTEDKFREVNFQRQQLQKRVSYLEELNTDLQVVADANKKLEHQLKRIGELESMLNVVAEENQLLKRKVT